ncbi:hypothetical protein ACFYRL_00905 [Streptomyces goshikiensis]|uniref:LppU/SCO3897 family protein n=1 Tax=Streptomyces goshikiensis TaxID=1942 RepID=UPI00366608EF
MSSQEIPLTLTPQQAAHGVILTVPLPGGTGTARLRIPPTSDGSLVRARLGGTDVLLRVRVAAGPGPGSTPSAAAGKAGTRGCLVAVAVLAAVTVGLVLLNRGGDGNDADDGNTAASAGPVPSPSYSPYSPAPAPPATATAAPDGGATASGAAPSPFDSGTCLNGTLPDSVTAQTVTGVREVSCSAADAHYKVIQSIPLTSDLNRCNDNPKTQYAFSYRYTRGGIPLSEYVYCLVGIGSYARP